MARSERLYWRARRWVLRPLAQGLAPACGPVVVRAVRGADQHLRGQLVVLVQEPSGTARELDRDRARLAAAYAEPAPPEARDGVAVGGELHGGVNHGRAAAAERLGQRAAQRESHAPAARRGQLATQDPHGGAAVVRGRGAAISHPAAADRARAGGGEGAIAAEVRPRRATGLEPVCGCNCCVSIR